MELRKWWQAGTIPATLHISVFGNHRAEAGATLSHPNWQIIASPVVPTGIEEEMKFGKRYFEDYSGRCCFCDMLEAERSRSKEIGRKAQEADVWEPSGDRLIEPRPRNGESERGFIAIAPYASHVPFEVWIMPTDHACRLEDSLMDENGEINPKKTQELATLLSDILKELHEFLEDPGYSLIVKNAPIPPERFSGLYDRYHWRIVIETQGLAIHAGYEHLTGIWSNVVPPEAAAAFLERKRKEKKEKEKEKPVS